MPSGRKSSKQRALTGQFDLQEGESIMRVISLRGSNIFEAEGKDGIKTLCLLPAKFNKSLWIKKGSYVVVDGGEREIDLDSRSKVTCIISQVLFEEQVKKLKKSQFWPAAFRYDEEQLFPLQMERRVDFCDTKKPKQESSAMEVTSLAQDTADTSCHGSSSDDDGLPPLEENRNRHSATRRFNDTSEEDDTDSDVGS